MINVIPLTKKIFLSLSSTPEPTSFSQVSKHESWLQVMQTELQTLELTNNWTIIDLPHNKSPIECKWV